MEVVAQGGSRAEAIDLVSALAPDMVLLDLNIPGGGSETLATLATDHKSVRCIILTASDCADTAIRMLDMGARGYVLKGVSGTDLLGAIRTVRNNASFISPGFATALLRAARVSREPVETGTGLSHREAQIMKGVENGLTNRQIGERLNLKEKTVKHYMSGVMQKYGVSNRVAAIMAHQKSRTPSFG